MEAKKNERTGGFVEATPIRFFDFVDKHLSYSKNNESLSTYKRDELCTKHLRHFFKNIWFDKLTPHDIEKFKSKRLEDGVKARTVNIELRCLSNMLRKAVKWNNLLVSPFSRVKLLKQRIKPPRFLTKQELQKLIDVATPRYKQIIKVLVNTGLRESELWHIKLEDINFRNKTMTVHADITTDFRVIPLNDEAYTEFTSLWNEFYSTTKNST